MFSQENFLLHAILPYEWTEADYNPDVATALTNAYSFITPEPHLRDAFRLARDHILRYANHRMSRRQRARVLYILGVARMNDGAYPHAHDYLEEALDYALALHSLAESAKLARLLGTIEEQAYHYALASTYHTLALDALDEGPYLPDPALIADTAIALASCHFALEHYDLTERYGAIAERHISYLPPASKQLATLKWVRAMYHRWRGEPDKGFLLASEAAVTYSAIGSSPAAQSRIEGIAADCACDLAEAYVSAGYGRYIYLDLARHYATRSLNLTTDGTDISGRALTLLREIRLARLTGASYNWLGAAEEVITGASSMGDMPVLTHAYTALGEQFTARDERESGLHCYRVALDALAGTDALHLGRWPRAAILMDGEMRID